MGAPVWVWGLHCFLCVGLVPGRACCFGPDGVCASATGGARKFRRRATPVACAAVIAAAIHPGQARGSAPPAATVFSVASTPATHSNGCVYAACWAAAMLRWCRGQRASCRLLHGLCCPLGEAFLLMLHMPVACCGEVHACRCALPAHICCSVMWQSRSAEQCSSAGVLWLLHNPVLLLHAGSQPMRHFPCPLTSL